MPTPVEARRTPNRLANSILVRFVGAGESEKKHYFQEERLGYLASRGSFVGKVEFTDAPERLTHGLALHPVPITLLTRLAVSAPWQGRGGRGSAQDAMRRTLQATDIAGIRAFAVHAKDDAARRWFVAAASDPFCSC